MPNHTPMPWEVGRVLRESEGNTYLYFSEQVDVFPPAAGPGEEQHGGPIACFSMSTENGQGNLALFIAAPAMLDACVEALSDLETWVEHGCRGCGSCQTCSITIPKLRSVIAAAEKR